MVPRKSHRRLFKEQGYEETTIAQIAREAGVSERTLFRYFGTKEDVLGGDQDTLGRLLKTTVQQQPAGVSAWDALRAGLIALVTNNRTQAQTLERIRLIFNTPSLRARYVEKRLSWQSELLPIVQLRMGLEQDPVDPRPRALVAGAFACSDAAVETWVASSDSLDVVELYDQCVAAVREQP
jgi:AcrR family transcriptional regulator